MSNLLGEKIYHKKFGDGIIVKHDKDLLHIKFLSGIKEIGLSFSMKKEIIKFENPEINKEILNNIHQQKENQINNFEIEFYSIGKKQIKTTKSINYLSNELYADIYTSLGSKAQTIYIDCCKKFGWNMKCKNDFGMMTHLFAYGATPEKYDVWFIAHSNLTEDMHDEHWINKLNHNQDKLYELWNNNDTMDKGADRIVFIKTSNSEYAFVGLYAVETVVKLESGAYKGRRLRIFKKVSEVYPK